MLGNLVPGSNTPSVTLLQVGRSPRCIKVMDGDTSFLRIHARSEHGLVEPNSTRTVPAFMASITALRALSVLHS